MGEFRRQQSKVWWSNDEESSRLSGLLGWGAAVDLSGELLEEKSLNNNSEAASNAEADNVEAGRSNWNDSKAERTWNNPELSGDRGSSSSPSQGSHKSQDSGFSDSELQNNALSESPQDSPDLSKRLDYPTYKANLDDGSTPTKHEPRSPIRVDVQGDYNKSISAIKKLRASPAKPAVEDINCNQIVSIKFLETNFDGNTTNELEKSDRGLPKTSPKCKRRNLIKTHLSRSKNDEKINQIQNQLELSSKLPKKVNLTQNLKISNLITQFQAKPQDETRSRFSKVARGDQTTDTTVDSLEVQSASECSERTVVERVSSVTVTQLDSEGFKIPKRLKEDCQSFKGSNNFLNLTEIEGPPVSSSTPIKIPRQESPVPKPTRATEKVIASTSTFATIRKLKGLAEAKAKGSKSLLSSFNRCGSFTKKTAKPKIDFESSTKQWLYELEGLYEAEVMTTLQSKSLATEFTRQVTNMATTTSETVQKLNQRTKVISSEFSKLCQHIKCKKYRQVGPLVQSLVGHVKEFIKDYVLPNNQSQPTESQRTEDEDSTLKNQRDITESNEMITDFRQPVPETKEVEEREKKKSLEEEVEEACDRLGVLTTQRGCDPEAVDRQVAHLGSKFTEVVDMLLTSHIKALVHVLEEPRTELALRTTLAALTSLGLEGAHLSMLVARCGGVRALLAVCLEARATAIRVSSLRALATICCIAETIRQLEEAGGVEILADLLTDESRTEAELSEGAAVLAQITAPWVEDNHSVKGLGGFLDSFVVSLTRIVREYKSSETLLLAAAALANLTFMEPRTVWPLLENNTAGILLQAVRQQGPKVSVFIQEQAATVIANMASVPESRQHLAEHRAVVALLCFLQIRHSPLQRTAEIAAAERVQQKSAIALSRLCSDLTVAKQVIELQGATRLVRLCKEEKERNHSDGVLVACLAALRKIVANCGNDAIADLNALELVEPKLLDSFLLYSTKQESYV